MPRSTPFSRLAASGRGVGDAGNMAMSIAAAVLLVAGVVAGIAALGLPEQVSCAIGSSVSQATATGGGDAGDGEGCAGARGGDTGADLAAGQQAGERRDTKGRGLEGFTARTDSTTWVEAYQECTTTSPRTCLRNGELQGCLNDGIGPDPRCPDPDRISLRTLRDCAPVTTADGQPSPSICIVELRGHDDPLVVRCSPDPDGTYSGNTARCTDSAQDGRTHIDPSAAMNLVSACQPLGAKETEDADGDDTTTVGWACAAWSGDVWSCSSTVAGHDTDDLGVLAASTGGRATTCDSRTFGDGALRCELPDPTSRAQCVVPADDSVLPVLDCALFAADASTTATSNVYGKPLHCRTETLGAADEVDCPTAQPIDDGQQPAGIGRGTITRQQLARLCSAGRSDGEQTVYDATRAAGRGNSSVRDVVGEISVRESGGLTESGLPGPGTRLATANVVALQLYLDGLSKPSGRGRVPRVLSVVIDDQPTRALFNAATDAPVAIVLSKEHAGSLFALAHEQAHVIAASVGLKVPEKRSTADWEQASVHEGFADSLAWLVTEANGEKATFVNDTRLGGPVTYQQVDARRGAHHNGQAIRSVTQDLYLSLLASKPGASPPSVAQTVGQVLVNAAGAPEAKTGLAGFQWAVTDSARQQGIPPAVVAAAFAGRGWPPATLSTGTCPITGTGTGNLGSSASAVGGLVAVMPRC